LANSPEIPGEWTETERWVWDQIALIDDAPVNLEHARLPHQFCLKRSEILRDDLTGCSVAETFLFGFSEQRTAHWEDSASLMLRNAHVGALQDWWRDETTNAWPRRYNLEGFTYSRLGSSGNRGEANMLDRSVKSYTQWLAGDPRSSPQPYEQLARCFYEVGEPQKATDVLHAARARRRRKAWSTANDFGEPKRREWLRAVGLWSLEVTIGYGLGNRYFRVLWWVGGLTLIGASVLFFFGSHPVTEWPRLLFASLDQLLPIVTLNKKAHDALIFQDASGHPQCYGVIIYFYGQRILGWILGSFLVAGLTQRN
jgi:hypothetical protein